MCIVEDWTIDSFAPFNNLVLFDFIMQHFCVFDTSPTSLYVRTMST